MPVLHAGPSLVSGTWATQSVCWLLTAPTLPWPERPKAAGGARRGTDRRSGPALASHDCLGIPASDPGVAGLGVLTREIGPEPTVGRPGADRRCRPRLRQ